MSQFFKGLTFFLFFVAPTFVFGETLYFQSQSSASVGSTFPVNFFINTDGVPINTISATIKSTSNIEIVEARYGGSLISLWVTQPIVRSEQKDVIFAGGITGGFNGTGKILTLYVKAKKEGKALISIEDTKVLINDGEGTESKKIKANPISIDITAKKIAPLEPKEVLEIPEDKIPPETLIISVFRDKEIESNKFMATFLGIDKDSGVSYYEIKEEPFVISFLTDSFNTNWSRSTSPYLLYFQHLASYVHVRAYDQSGNVKESMIYKPFSVEAGVSIIIIVAILSGFTALRLRRLKKIIKDKIGN